ncbi:hypothetical protein D3C76_1688230 [compost metagenome]
MRHIFGRRDTLADEPVTDLSQQRIPLGQLGAQVVDLLEVLCDLGFKLAVRLLVLSQCLAQPLNFSRIGMPEHREWPLVQVGVQPLVISSKPERSSKTAL